MVINIVAEGHNCTYTCEDDTSLIWGSVVWTRRQTSTPLTWHLQPFHHKSHQHGSIHCVIISYHLFSFSWFTTCLHLFFDLWWKSCCCASNIYFLIIFLPRGFRKTAAFDNTFSLFSICFHLLSSSVIVAPVQVGVVWFCLLSIYPQCISNWQRHVQRFSRVTLVALSCKPAAEMRSSFRGLINSVPSNFTPTRFIYLFHFQT